MSVRDDKTEKKKKNIVYYMGWKFFKLLMTKLYGELS